MQFQFFMQSILPFLGFDILALAAASHTIRNECKKYELFLKKVDFYQLIFFLYRHKIDCPSSTWEIKIDIIIFNYIGVRLFQGLLPGFHLMRHGQCFFTNTRNNPFRYSMFKITNVNKIFIDRRLNGYAIFLNDCENVYDYLNIDGFLSIYLDIYSTKKFEKINLEMIENKHFTLLHNI